MNNKPYALITGASSGIGKSIARELARLKYPLVLASNQEEALQQTATELKKAYGIECVTCYCDLSDQQSAKKLFDFCVQRKLQISILVNNAGILLYSEVADADAGKIETILNLHVHTPAMLCHYFLTDMKKQKQGYILNVSSISAVMPYPNISLYGPTKTFMRYFTRALRFEGAKHGISVSCLIPGPTATGLYDPDKVNLNLALRLGIMQKPETVARAAIRGMFKKKAEIVPGWLSVLLVKIVPLAPAMLIKYLFLKTSLPEKLRKML
jgi:short-subunit dehydrogenase